MIDALVILAALAALLGTVAGVWLYGTEAGWLRRHGQRGQVSERTDTLTTTGGWAPPSGYGVTHWRVWVCPCGEEQRRG